HEDVSGSPRVGLAADQGAPVALDYAVHRRVRRAPLPPAEALRKPLQERAHRRRGIAAADRISIREARSVAWIEGLVPAHSLERGAGGLVWIMESLRLRR